LALDEADLQARDLGDIMEAMITSLDVKRWVGEQLAALHSVRSCILNREGLLIAHTWGGGIIHVHFLDALPKLRAIRLELAEATRVGIGTLYLLDAALLPADGARAAPDGTLIGLHALYKDKLYTYRAADDVNEPHAPKIGQVHFKSFGRSDEYETWYGPDIEIRALPCYRVWVKSPPALKGEWQIANFGSEAFWKDADYTAGRDQVRRKNFHDRTYTTDQVFRQHSWTNSTYTNIPGGMPGGIPADMGGGSASNGAENESSANRRPASPLDHHYARLGLKSDASGDDVKAAFRRLARELHPDVSKLPMQEAKAKFQQVYEAYKALRDAGKCA